MRFIFITISFLSLLMIAFCISEIRSEREFGSKVKQVQEMLADLNPKNLPLHNKTDGFPNLAALGSELDGVEIFERAWSIAACGSTVIFIFGIAGIIVERK